MKKSTAIHALIRLMNRLFGIYFLISILILCFVLGLVIFFIGKTAILIFREVSILMAILIAEILPRWLKSLVRPVLDLLVGIPSIVYGYLGLTVLIPILRKVPGETLGDGHKTPLSFSLRTIAFLLNPSKNQANTFLTTARR
nr:hypothetical protein [Paenibacillus sp. CAA11]